MIVAWVTAPVLVGAQDPLAAGFTVTPVTLNGYAEVRTSVSVTDRASEGPRLSTWMSQKPVVPAGAGSSGLHTLMTARSARSSTMVPSVKVLLRVSVSLSPATETVLVIVTALAFPRIPLSTWTLIVNVFEAEAADVAHRARQRADRAFDARHGGGLEGDAVWELVRDDGVEDRVGSVVRHGDVVVQLVSGNGGIWSRGLADGEVPAGESRSLETVVVDVQVEPPGRGSRWS